jgi:hypothetical protein
LAEGQDGLDREAGPGGGFVGKGGGEKQVVGDGGGEGELEPLRDEWDGVSGVLDYNYHYFGNNCKVIL